MIFRKKQKKPLKKNKKIFFDIDLFWAANPQAQKEIDSGIYVSIEDYLESVDIVDAVENGSMRFHPGYIPFEEEKYFSLFPDVKEEVAIGNFKSAFDHFVHFGYKEIVEGRRSWLEIDDKCILNDERSQEEEKIIQDIFDNDSPKTVIAIIGIPRSGLTLSNALVGLLDDTTTWFLPYSTRKNFDIKSFDDFSILETAYLEAFPKKEVIQKNISISESTADEDSMPFIFDSLDKLRNQGVTVKIIWVTRNVNYTFMSQMEAAYKYWGAKDINITEESYKEYMDFVLRGYSQITSKLSHFDHTIISYNNLVKYPMDSFKKISDFLSISGVETMDQIDFHCMQQFEIAGDPSFYDNSTIVTNRDDVHNTGWQKVNDYEKNLSEPMQKFVHDFNRMVNSIVPTENFLFTTYMDDLLRKEFDAEYYLEQYSDIGEAEVDPFDHYMDFGWKEDRNPTPWFETKWYKENVFYDGDTPSFHHYIWNEKYHIRPGRSIGVMEGLKLIDPENYVISEELLLTAPKFKKPKVSIIIPAYNQEAYTMACIQSIIENTEEGVSYEIIVMDDKSPDESARLIEQNLKNVKFITNGVNYGFLLNCNKGATFAIGEYILFLNNDTNVQPGWLSSLVELIESSDDIGMVGSRLVYPGGEQQEAGGLVWDDASGWNFGRMDDPNKPEYNYVKEADYLTGAAMMIRASLWEEIGGFDERYVPAYYEDTDLAFEVRKHGYRTLYQPKSVVIHFEGISNGTDLGSGIKHYQIVNKENFYNKWQEVLEQEHFPNADEVFLARDHSAGKKHLLYVDHYLPHYDQDAGSKATLQYLKILAENNIQVHFIGDNFYNYPDTPYLDALQQMGVEVLHGKWYEKHWEEWFAENGKYFEYAVLSRPHIAVKYVDVIKAYSDAKIIYMGHDLHFLREQREYKIKGDEKYKESAERWQKEEMDLIHRCDISYFFSDVEKEKILKIDPYAAVDVVPLYIYSHFKEIIIPTKNRQDVMFVGGFAHSPNVDAMIWFVNKIWPKVVKYLPNIKFYIIGSKVPDEILALASDRVIVTGYVDDETLDSYYKKCKVVVAPMRYGAGIKGKIVDALYNGMPLVTTSIGAEGLNNAKSAMMVSDKPKKFAKKIIELYVDDELAGEYAQNALEYCAENFSVEMAKNKMSNIFEEFKE